MNMVPRSDAYAIPYWISEHLNVFLDRMLPEIHQITIIIITLIIHRWCAIFQWKQIIITCLMDLNSGVKTFSHCFWRSVRGEHLTNWATKLDVFIWEALFYLWPWIHCGGWQSSHMLQNKRSLALPSQTLQFPSSTLPYLGTLPIPRLDLWWNQKGSALDFWLNQRGSIKIWGWRNQSG